MPTPVTKALRPTAIIRRHFIADGLLGGNRKWLVAGGIVWAFQLLREHVGTGGVGPVYTEELLPGEKLIISHKPASGKRRR